MFHHCSTEPNKIRVLIGPIRAQSEDELCHIQSHCQRNGPRPVGWNSPKKERNLRAEAGSLPTMRLTHPVVMPVHPRAALWQVLEPPRRSLLQ